MMNTHTHTHIHTHTYTHTHTHTHEAVQFDYLQYSEHTLPVQAYRL